MSTPTGSVRQRGPKKKKSHTNVDPSTDSEVEDVVSKVRGEFKTVKKSEWDYRLACTVITILAFVSRFWGISHPNQVVFDEVHFGKVILFHFQCF